MSKNVTTTRNYFPVLTGLRAIAAFMVFVHHFPNGIPSAFAPYTREGYLGVPIFFVLSGFLITYRYDESSQLSWDWLKKYYLNRIARIYPLYLLVTVLSLWVAHERNVFIWIANLTFIRGFFASILFSGVAQGWTLSVEECFYISAPLVFVLSRRIGLFLPICLIAATGFILVHLAKYVPLYGFFANHRFMLLYTFPGSILQFYAGICLARHLRSGIQSRLNGIPITILSGIALSCWFVLPSWLRPGHALFGTEYALGLFAYVSILPVVIAMLLYGLVTEDTWISRILGSPLMDLLGKSSYAFYLIHMGVISTFVAVHLSSNIWVLLLVLLLFSIIIHWYIEEPLRHLVLRISTSRFNLVFRVPDRHLVQRQ